MVYLYCPHSFVPEKTYAASVLLGELLGIPFTLLATQKDHQYCLELPNGAQLNLEDHFFGAQHDETYLHSSNIPEQPIVLPHPFEPGENLIGLYGRPLFKQEGQTITCGLDLLASTFFMLTRWEEQVVPDRDQFGRFPAAAALAVRAGFLDRPLVNEYAAFLWQILLRLGWNQPLPERQFCLHLSHDVDHPRLWWSASERLRTLGGSLFQRKNRQEAAYWWKNHLFRAQDPFDVFDDWMHLAETKGLQAHFNFLGERLRRQDCYYPLAHPFVRDLLRKIDERGHVIGFHPSREAFQDATRFAKELDSLRRATPQPVRTGRQHYLCFEAPETWRRWEEAGMAWDSTLGYPEAEGFRCGICCDFPVFDVAQRKTLTLREKPLLAMDVTLAQYRGYTPAEASEKLQHLRRQVQKHRGEFVLLWHNSSWNTYFWAPWQAVYLDFVHGC
ncbi:MAG: polysaccharide deacetylase family protein [Saprospiraceae bacterium]|nr:polysaccharide deacetylase family protein [Saprospiraceae bacterium]